MKKVERKKKKKITGALHRVSPRTMSESQSTFLRNTSGWLLPTHSIIRKKKLMLMAQKKVVIDSKQEKRKKK